MILPNKYLKFKDSMIYQATTILKIISKRTISFDRLWIKYSNANYGQYSYLYYIYLIEFMYITKMINYTENGELYNENLRIDNKE